MLKHKQMKSLQDLTFSIIITIEFPLKVEPWVFRPVLDRKRMQSKAEVVKVKKVQI